MFWVLICTINLTVCSSHVTYPFGSECTLYSCLNLKELLAQSGRKIWSLSDSPGLKLRTTKFVNKYSTNWPNYQIDWAVFWVLICTMHLTVCSPYFTYAFQSDSPLYSYLSVKGFHARSRRESWSLSDWTYSNSERLSSYTNTQPFGRTSQMIELCSEYLPVWCIWLYVFVMSRTRLRVNPHSIVAWMSRKSLLKARAKSEV